MLLNEVMESQLTALGVMGLDKIKTSLHDLVAESAESWKKDVLTIVSDAVDAFGPAGVNKAMSALHDLVDGKPADLDWADLEAASNLLAAMQNQEAEERTAIKVFLRQVGGVIMDIVTGAVMGL